MTVSLVWATPDADALIARIARVSNPANEGNDATAPRLLAYLIRNRHWSPFEMASVCMEVVTTRDIGRQLLRHYLRPQEFSQRYQDVRALGEPVFREARMQDATNRQASIPCEDEGVRAEWLRRQQAQWDAAVGHYTWALDRGFAKEVARVVMPEGNTPTRMYFAGQLRQWLHFCEVRRGHGTQPEAVAVAEGAWDVLRGVCPAVVQAWEAASGQTASANAIPNPSKPPA